MKKKKLPFKKTTIQKLDAASLKRHKGGVAPQQPAQPVQLTQNTKVGRLARVTRLA